MTMEIEDGNRTALQKAREFIEDSAFNVPTKDYFDAVLKTIDEALATPATPATPPAAGSVTDAPILAALIARGREYAKATIKDQVAENGERLTYEDSIVWNLCTALEAVISAAPVPPVVGEDAVERMAEAINAARYDTDMWRDRARPSWADEDRSSREYAFRLARAALASSVAKPCGVKALEWAGPALEFADGSGARLCEAECSPFGHYIIYRDDRIGGKFLVSHSLWTMTGDYPTLEDAKAAAQADYEGRILSCLSHPAQGWRWINEPVRVHGEDFEYEAICLCSFPKRNGKVRYIVEDNGRIFVQRREQLKFAEDAGFGGA